MKLVGEEYCPVVIGSVLDDTGSSYLELYMEDAIALGLTAQYNYLGSIVRLETSNGAVFRLTFQIEVRPILDGGGFGHYVKTMACLVPTTGINQSRSSGTFLRQEYFTGSSPDGHLVVSKAKSNVRF